MENKNITDGIASEEKQSKLSSLWNKAKDKVVKIADQNDDGTFDMADLSSIANTIGSATKSAAEAAMTAANEKAKEMELKALAPVLPDTLNSADFFVTKLIRLTDIDKRHAESPLCEGAIGHMIHQKDFDVLNIYKASADQFGLTFYPDMDSDLYYADPTDRNHYIALDNYFGYLKDVRVTELQRIAQDLGAKHFRVVYKERKATITSTKVKAKTGGKVDSKNNVGIEATHENNASEVSTIGIAAENFFPGQDPVMPKLRYLQNDLHIRNLVALRMNTASPLGRQLITIELKNSAGIKEQDALKIDTVLKGLKITGNTTVTAEVQNESRRFFEYEIDF